MDEPRPASISSVNDTKAIPMVDVAKEISMLRKDIDNAIRGVLDSGRFIGGPEVASFEEELASLSNSKHAVGVSSGTDALLCSLMSLGVGPGDEVITTAFTFFATAGVIARLGATPVFADIDPNNFCLDPAAVEKAISKKTKAILPVNLFGRIADLPETDIPVLEDAAQSIGTSPPRGIAAAISFFPTKNVGAVGDAGAILTHDDDFAAKLKLMRNHGAKPKYYHALVGGNFRLDAIQAAILRVKLPKLEAWNKIRRDNANRYRKNLKASKLPEALRLPDDSPEHIYHQFTLRVPRRDELRQYLRDRQVASEVYYPVPLHLQECFSHLGYAPRSLPHTEKAASEVLSLPVHPTIDVADQEKVVELIESFYQS